MTSRMTRGRFALISGSWFLAMAWGCGQQGDRLPRRAVEGTVTIDGRPVNGALIRFEPSDPKTLTTASAEVKDGKFLVDQERGPVPGRYKVKITLRPAPLPASATETGEKANDEPEDLPPEYNAQTILSAEVKGDGPNLFHFPLASNSAGR